MSIVQALVLASFALSLAARADSANLIFDPGILDVKQYALDPATGRLLGPSGKVLQVGEEKMPPPEAAKALKNRLFQLQTLYAPQTAAYPGMLTKGTACIDTVFLAKSVQKAKSESYWFSEIPATGGFVYGTCGSAEEPYWSQKLLLYCEDQRILYDIRLFVPKGKTVTRIRRPVAKCRPATSGQ